MDFAAAAIDADPAALAVTREAVVAAMGEAAAVEAAGVIGNFQMMNRILDGVGIPPAPRYIPIAAELGIDLEENHG